MRAVRIRDGRPVLRDAPEPSPTNEAVIRVELAGICGTDLELLRGYLSFDGIPGHEFVGVVERAPEPRWEGRRVVGEINVPCGRCETCRLGHRRHCPGRSVLGILHRDGAFADRLALPVANLHEVPASMAPEVAVFAEPLAAAWEIVEQVPVGPEVRSLVIGAGRLGQLCAAVLARAGCPPVVVGGSEGKRRRLRDLGVEAFAADHRLAREFDLVVEASGSPTGLVRALEVVRPLGTIVLKSTYHGPIAASLAPVVIDEVHIVGSRCGPFEPALRHLDDDPLLTRGLVTDRFDLAHVDAAFDAARRRDALKILIAP